MKFGVHLPHVGPQASRETLREFAPRVEALGYDSLWVSDHIVIPRGYESRYPYNPSGSLGWTELPLLEPLSTLLFVAAITERVQLGTTVLVVTMRNPVLHAKVMATLDVLSGGRLILGAGSGWMKEEFDALGEPFDQRGQRMEEYLEAMISLWTKDDPTYKGSLYEVGNIACYPKPLQQPHPPIWIGGNTTPALKRAGRMGQAWHGAGSSPEDVERAKPVIHEAARAAGRSPDAIDLTVRTGIRLGQDEAFVERMRQYKAAGVSHVCLETGYSNMARAYETLEHFARDLRPHIEG
jgi:probable F420-dependent oxidoreductase